VNDFEQDLSQRLAGLRQQGLSRALRENDAPCAPRLRLAGQTLLNFASNDYLGLANEPSLKEAAVRAIERYGAGAGASRLLAGSLTPHHELDELFAAFKGTQAALSFSTGYTAAIGVIGALLDKDDCIILDRLVHACIVDAARLSGARLRVFAHNDLDELEDILRWTRRRTAGSSPEGGALEDREGGPSVSGKRPRTLVVTESVFSMDGDQAPLRELVELKDRYGAWLMVDEAHATGIYGPHRRGLADALGVSDRIEVQMSTLGKALGAAGGCIAGSRTLIDCLINRARPFIFSTAPVPAAAAAAAAGVRFVQSNAGAERCRVLWERASEVAQILEVFPRSRVATAGAEVRSAPPDVPHPAWSAGSENPPTPSAIFPIHIGDEAAAVAAAARLQQQGIFLPAIRYPTVARGAARLRLTVTAAHTGGDLRQLKAALEHEPPKIEDRKAKIPLGPG